MTGDAASTTGAGSSAGIDKCGTVGACASWVVSAWCAQCAGHNAGFCGPCVIGMPSQCAVMPTFAIGMATVEQAYDAKATCWNRSDNTASSTSRKRVRRVSRRHLFTASVYSTFQRVISR